MISRLEIERWIELDAAHPAPTFFARPAWALALADATPSLEPWPLRVAVDGRSFVVPAMRSSSRLPIKHIVAFPLGGYTCILDEHGQCASTIDASRVCSQLARYADRAEIVPWPLGPQPVWAHARRRRLETAVIDCSAGYDAVLANVRGVTRRMAGQAARRGVVVAPSAGGRADVDDYYDILKEASEGWGLSQPPYPHRLLRAVMERGRPDAEIWFATVDGERIAGGVVLYGADELFFWSAAMRRSHSQFRPSNALNLALIQNACERGLRWYNLGASEGLAGVERFKHDLGAQALDYSEFSYKRAHVALLERMRGALRSPAEAR